jgi:hypothetical protein
LSIRSLYPGGLLQEARYGKCLFIIALEKLRAGDALPRLHALLNDHEKSHFGAQISVADAAKAAIAALETKR